MTLLFTGLAIYRKTWTNGGIFHNKNLHENSAYHRGCKRKTSYRTFNIVFIIFSSLFFV